MGNMEPSNRMLANALRVLSMDAVQAANSGHPGMPMGMADIAEVLWRDYLKHNPSNPHWADRDRFVLSNGHGSMLLYAMLHLSGYDLPLNELKRFRQLGSKTPGHPEYGVTPGVETTTGPLGQGLAMAVGMALAERLLASRFNRNGYELIDHHTYVFVGDGCLMEGVSHEAGSLAGTLGLDKLIVFYDDNGISIDGDVRGWFRDDTAARFEAYGWCVIRDVDGHDRNAIQAAIEQARVRDGRPVLIDCRTIIGWGAPNKQGSEGVHGAALGEVEVQAARERLGWTYPPFEIPPEIYAAWDARARGEAAESAWQDSFAVYREHYPELATELGRRLSGELPPGWDERVGDGLARMQSDGTSMATRKASQQALNNLGSGLPELVGGSADLTGSNCTRWDGARVVEPGHLDGDYLCFGVREFGMTAALNGMALHGGFIPYGGTFLTFSDYARNAVRLAAMMGVRHVLVYTHDSIGLGEDGPTHQPIEHVASLRLIPNLDVWRPCDAVETLAAWHAALDRGDGPTALALSRQTLPHQARDAEQLAAIRRGGYVLWQPEEPADALVIATGSEVGLAVEAARRLHGEGIAVRVVSMPCVEVFERQDIRYRQAVLPSETRARVAVEAGASAGWWRYVGDEGRVMGLDSFGESAPSQALFKHFNLTVDGVIEQVRDLLDSSSMLMSAG